MGRARYVEHPSKVGAFRGGQMVVYPDAVREDCTVWSSFEIGDEQGPGEELWEGLLARRLSPDRARICAVPVFVYDVNLGDEVAVAESEEGALLATGVVRDAGSITIRVMFQGATKSDPNAWRALMADLEVHDCWFDVWSERVVAVAIPSDHLDIVTAYLTGRWQAGELRWEHGRRALQPT
jgi:hypothetical protein